MGVKLNLEDFHFFFADKQPSQTNEKESLLMVALMCATKTEKIECLRTQSGRLLDSLEHVLNAKRDEVLGKLDNLFLIATNSLSCL